MTSLTVHLYIKWLIKDYTVDREGTYDANSSDKCKESWKVLVSLSKLLYNHDDTTSVIFGTLIR